MTTAGPAAPPSTRSALARDKLMRTAERLYAERGFAGVSVRQIGEAAGQRNKSAVQYHFNSRDELIMAILSRHITAVERHRAAMVDALGATGDIAVEDRVRCLILPTVEHHIELGTPAWHARFLAQAVVEPNLRDYTVRQSVGTPSMRRLLGLADAHRRGRDPELLAFYDTMVLQLTVQMCAVLEYDLAHGRIPASSAEESWRRLGAHMIKAISGLTTTLLGVNP